MYREVQRKCADPPNWALVFAPALCGQNRLSGPRKLPLQGAVRCSSKRTGRSGVRAFLSEAAMFSVRSADSRAAVIILSIGSPLLG